MPDVELHGYVHDAGSRGRRQRPGPRLERCLPPARSHTADGPGRPVARVSEGSARPGPRGAGAVERGGSKFLPDVQNLKNIFFRTNSISFL